MVNRARPISDYADGSVEPEREVAKPVKLAGTLYLRLPSQQGKLFPKIKAILNMFPGESQAVLYFADTKVRLGTRCQLAQSMMEELKNVLGEGNVVLK